VTIGGEERGAMAVQLELPSDGVVTRATFEALPTPAPGWAWELHDSRLELVHMPVSVWHWQIIMIVLEYWRRQGHEVAGEQYIADSGFLRGGTGRNNRVADGVVFRPDHRPRPRDTTHDPASIHAVVEAVSDRSEENDAVEKVAVYASLQIPHYWVVRGDAETEEIDGMVTMYELRDGGYEVVGHRLVSRLIAA
jgi:Uma2 family endonuclease